MNFNPKTDGDYLVYVLKLAYRYSLGDLDVGSDEINSHLLNVLCNEIGDKAFQDFVDSLD